LESVKDAERILEALDLLEEEKVKLVEYERGKNNLKNLEIFNLVNFLNGGGFSCLGIFFWLSSDPGFLGGGGH
jgi:hypothetical protein